MGWGGLVGGCDGVSGFVVGCVGCCECVSGGVLRERAGGYVGRWDGVW